MVSEWWTGERFDDFAAWVRATIGERAMQNINKNNWKSSSIYQQWLSLNRPRVAQPSVDTTEGVSPTETPSVPASLEGDLLAESKRMASTLGIPLMEYLYQSGFLQRPPTGDASSPDNLNAWQRAQIGFQRQDQELKRQQLAASQQGPTDRERSLELQQFKTQTLLDLERGGPVNWIKAYQTRSMPVSFYQRPPNAGERLQDLQDMQQKQQELAQWAFDRAFTPTGGDRGVAPAGVGTPEAHMLNVGREAIKTIEVIGKGIPPLQEEAAAEQQQAVASGQAFGAPNLTPNTPPAPSFLSQFAPSQVTGKPITPSIVTNPSAQQWAGLTPSQQQKFHGYVDFSNKQEFGDLLGGMASSLPRDPRGSSTPYVRSPQQRVGR